MIIAIDFDGTLVRSDYPHIHGLQPYAKEVMHRLKDEGHYLILWTCRKGEELMQAINYLLGQGIPFDRINDHHPGNLQSYGGQGGKKIYADLYVDDRVPGGFVGWQAVERYVDSLTKSIEPCR